MAEYPERKDPDSSLDLMWGTRERPSRGPKPGLTLQQIIDSAIKIADADGLAALSMRRVADQLGVGTMSLYTYVPGKAELIDVMQDTVVGEAARSDSAAGGWRAKLELLAREDWALYRRHPWALQVERIRRVPGPNEIEAFDSALSAVSGIGLTASEMVAAVTLVVGYVQGHARHAVETAQTERRTGVTDDQFWSGRTALYEKFDCDRFPALTSVWEAGGFDEPEDNFEFGLQRVLDGIEKIVNARSAQPDARP